MIVIRIFAFIICALCAAGGAVIIQLAVQLLHMVESMPYSDSSSCRIRISSLQEIYISSILTIALQFVIYMIDLTFCILIVSLDNDEFVLLKLALLKRSINRVNQRVRHSCSL